jgi:hypothetical protein
LAHPTADTASETSSALDLDISDVESLSEPIFSRAHAKWEESPVIGSILPLTSLHPGLITGRTSRPHTPSSLESESSWLAQKDIQSAVRKSFHGGSPRRTSPIILESSVLSPIASSSPLKIDGLSVAASNTRMWARAEPDYMGEDYGEEDLDEGDGRVRQGSMAKAVEVKRGVEGVQGVVPRVSGESPDRQRTGGIVLF